MTSESAQEQNDELADRLRGFGPLGLLAILIILLSNLAGGFVSGLLVLIWAHVSRTPNRDLGLTAPRSWPLTIALGVTFGIVFKLVMKAVVMPLLHAPAVNMRYHYLAGNRAALPVTIATMVLAAGVGEELFFRSYLFERLRKRFGSGRGAVVAIVVMTSVLFAVEHYDQGFTGIEQAAMTGLVFGSIYAWRKRIWGVMIAHAAYDLTAVLLIYKNWEVAVAHWLFPR